jgi:biotin operon repressor
MEYTVDNLLKLDAEGLSHSEIGKQLGKSKSMIGAKLRRLKNSGVKIREREIGKHPLGKKPDLSNRKPRASKKVEPKPIAMKPNRNTIMTRPYNHQHMSKRAMYDMLAEAVRNTK